MKADWKNELGSLKYFAGRVWWASPGYVLAACAESLLEAVLPFIAIVLPKLMIDELTGGGRIPVLAGYVGTAAAAALALSVMTGALKRYMKVAVRDILVKFEADMGEHSMGVAYANLEDVAYMDQKNRAMLPVRDRMTHLFMAQYLPDMVRYTAVAAGSLGILLSFGLLSLVAIMIPTVLITLLNRRYQKKDMEIQKASVCMERDFSYYAALIDDFSPAKDIRLFGIHSLLLKRNHACDEKIISFKARSARLRYGFEGNSKLLEACRSGFVYGYIGVKSLVSGIGIGDFTMYISAASTFSTAVGRLLEQTVTLRQDCRYLEEYVKLQRIPVEKQQGGIKDLDVHNMCLEFDHVSFRYPGSGTDVLKDVSFCLNPGESISIVGKNGAGKTTIIKLISRLFQPAKGRILVNGRDIQEIDAQVYQNMLAVVFQDFKIFQFSVAENVAAGENVDAGRLEKALETAGIMNKIRTLESGTNTYAGKQFDQSGTEFSGGELQKLAIARALYKDAPVIVLDEPTAALDPLAEEEVYERFHDLTGGKSTVYISHRLSSCKFCSRILLLEDGGITEDGNHEELMALDGSYAEMFKLQASQYVCG